jgi:3-hydroxyacyl-[acyl-carrier-protein] dehydratase
VGSEQVLADRKAIEALIPHRAPFLFVDRILERTAASILIERDVEASEPAFAGHYPGRPILPGVLIAEFCFQGAALLMADPGHNYRPGDPVPVLTRIESARFKQMVTPGQTLQARVELVDQVGTARYMKARVTSGGVRVLDTRFTVALASQDLGTAAAPLATPPIEDMPDLT